MNDKYHFIVIFIVFNKKDKLCKILWKEIISKLATILKSYNVKCWQRFEIMVLIHKWFRINVYSPPGKKSFPEEIISAF